MGPYRAIAVVLGCCGWIAAELTADEQTASGQAGVNRALAGVDRWLEGSPHAEAWHKRLDTHALRRALAKKASPNLAAVERWLERTAADGTTAAQAPSGLRRSVEAWLVLESLPGEGRYLATVASSILRAPTQGGTGPPRAESQPPQKRLDAHPEPSRSELRKHLVALTAMLSRYARQADEELARAMDEELTWLEAAGQADTLVDAVRQYYDHPNVWIDVSEEILDDPVVQTIDRREPVTDVILGTPLAGNGRLQAQSDLVIQPDSNRAILKIVVHGQVDAQTTGRGGPARIHSRTITSFQAEKRLIIEQNGLKVLPTVCGAELNETSSGVSSVKGGLRGRIIRRIAQRRWQASRPAAHEEAARHVEAQVAAAIDREANELIERLDRLVLTPIRVLANSGSSKNAIRFCSDHGVLRIGIRRGRLGAPPGMPPTDARRLFTVRIHSSLVNPMAALTPSFSELSWSTPSKALESVALLTQPERFLQASFASEPSGLASPLSSRFWQELAWQWVDGTISPRLDSGGIALREGRWGRLTSGGAWTSLEWQPVADLSTELSARLRSLR